MSKLKVILITVLLAAIPSLLFFGFAAGFELSIRDISLYKPADNDNGSNISQLLIKNGFDEAHTKFFLEDSFDYEKMQRLQRSEYIDELDGGELKIVFYTIFFEAYLRLAAVYEWTKPPISTGRDAFSITIESDGFVTPENENPHSLNLVDRQAIYKVAYKNSDLYKIKKTDNSRYGSGYTFVFPSVGASSGYLAFNTKPVKETDSFNVSVLMRHIQKKLFYESTSKSAYSPKSEWAYNLETGFTIPLAR